MAVNAQSLKEQSAWGVATPEEYGLSSTDLNGIFDYVRQQKNRVHSIQILRHGVLVVDVYFYPYDAKSRHDVASVTKSTKNFTH